MAQQAPKRHSEGGALLSKPSSCEGPKPAVVATSLGQEPCLHGEASVAREASDCATSNTMLSAAVANEGERDENGGKSNSVTCSAGIAQDRELPVRSAVQDSTESTHEPKPTSDYVEPSGVSEAAAAKALTEAHNELATAKELVSTLEKALDESRSEIHVLREEVARGKSSAEQQAREMALLRYAPGTVSWIMFIAICTLRTE